MNQWGPGEIYGIPWNSLAQQGGIPGCAEDALGLFFGEQWVVVSTYLHDEHRNHDVIRYTTGSQ